MFSYNEKEKHDIKTLIRASMQTIEGRFTMYLQKYKNFEFSMSIRAVFKGVAEPIVIPDRLTTVYVSDPVNIILENMGKTLLYLIAREERDLDYLTQFDTYVKPLRRHDTEKH